MKRLMRVVMVAIMAVGIMAVAARPVAAAPIGLFLPIEVDCGEVRGVLAWNDIPDGAAITVFLENANGPYGSAYAYVVGGGNPGAGELAIDLPFLMDYLDGWTYSVVITDNTNTEIYVAFGGPITRECVNGTVSPGATGSDDDAAAPTDARSGATTEVEEEEPVEDPDGDGRVQVP